MLSDTDREEIYRKIGRNAFQFQLVEAIFKLLLSNSNFSGSLNEIETIREKHVVSINKQTLGQLTGQFTKTILSNTDAVKAEVEEPDEVLAEIRVSFDIKIEVSSSDYEQQKELLARVVSERNELTHQFFQKYDLSSADSYNAAIQYLDQQYESLLPVFEDLKQYALAFDNLNRAAAEYFASDECKQILSNQTDTVAE